MRLHSRVVLVLAFVLATELALADEKPDSDVRANAAQLFEAAMSDYDRGDLGGAIEKLRAAELAAPHPKVLYNLAQILDAAGKRAEAFRAFDEYLTLAGDQVDEARRQAVQARLAELTQQLATLRVDVDPAAATLNVDAEPAKAHELHLEPGRHLLELSAPGFQPAQLTLTAVSGETQHVVVRLIPVAKPAAPAAPPPHIEPRARPNASPPPRPKARTERTWATILVGAGAALATGAVVTHFVNSSRTQDWEASDRRLDAVDPTARGDAYWKGRADNATLARNIRYGDGIKLGLLVGAGALATTGVTLWFAGGAGDPRTAFGVGYARYW